MGKAEYLPSQVHEINFLPSWQTELQFGRLPNQIQISKSPW